MESSVLTLFLFSAQARPDSLCIVDADGPHTYRDMETAASRMGEGLKKRGAEYGSRIMAACDDRAHYLALELACWMAGAIFVPVEADAAAQRMSDIYDDAAPVLYVSDRLPGPEKLREVTVSYEQLQEDGGEGLKSYADPKGEDTAEILFTTGTTGRSKGVELSHRADVALAENIAEGVGMREGNVELNPMPLSHAMGIRCCYANYLRGGCSLLVDGVTGVRHIYELMKTYHATGMDLSPTAASVLLKLSKGKFRDFAEQLDFIHLGTAYLNDEVKENLRETFPGVRLYNVYGSTESGRSCYYEFSGPADRRHCIGLPGVHAKFMIADENHNEIRSDENHMGFIACKGDMNMKGYWKQKELTETVLQNGYLFTRDEGYIDRDGYVYILGRADDVINFRGIKIAPDEIEEAAAPFPGIRDCACIPAPDRMSGQIPVLVIDAEEKDFDKKAFMHYLRDHIDADKVPQKVVFFHDIPRSFNGKLQRKKLVQKLAERK